MAEQKREKGAPALNVEKEIGELEERVDRLRVLYEQYFLGFEKLEPSVPRKDVERRFAVLRKENIRNTALRYRFNVVNQKYNTYSMHWTRICRQIEEGTFKRHVKRAQERFGDAARGRRPKEKEEAGFDVDIDFEDLDSMNMDDVLAEADRAAAKYDRAPTDTVPPVSAPPNSSPTPAPQTSPRPAPSNPIERVARPAQLPVGAGSKPKLIRKVVKGPDAGGSNPPPSSPDSSRTPAARPAPAPSGAIRGPMPSAPGMPTASPSGRMPIAPGGGVGVGPQSERRLPVPAAPTSDRRIPIPAAPPSDRRMPAVPAAPAAGPAAAPPPAQSERRLPVPPPNTAPGVRPMIRPAIRPATQSRPDLENDRPSQPNPQAAPQAQPRPPAPAPLPSRPRAPLPLPSQTNRDEKK